MADGSQLAATAYLKAPVSIAQIAFVYSVAIDANTMVVGVPGDDSDARGINGDPSNSNAPVSGAAIVFVREGAHWKQQAYLKASNADANDMFGWSVAISGDTIVVGAYAEAGSAKGVDGDGTDNSSPGSGAAYIFVRSGTTWSQQAYLKAFNVGIGDAFGNSVSISGDTVVVGALREDGDGRSPDSANNAIFNSGAAYVFSRQSGHWTQEAYLKARYPGESDSFGTSVAVSGGIIVVGAPNESWAGPGGPVAIHNGGVERSGAAYIFSKKSTGWEQSFYLKASIPEHNGSFGQSVAVSGNTVAVGSPYEHGSSSGVDSDPILSPAADASGAAYVFVRNQGVWSQQAYIKASNTGPGYWFGSSVAINGDSLVVGSPYESSNATGIDGPQFDTSLAGAGSAYVFARSSNQWTQTHYLKPSNTRAQSYFGFSVATSGHSLVVGAYGESGLAVGVDGDDSTTGAANSGAAYVFANQGPETITLAATEVTDAGAAIAGLILPVDAECLAYLEFGTSASYGSRADSVNIPLGTPSSTISVRLSGLTSGALYHFRAVAGDQHGTNYGADRTFRVGPLKLPVVETLGPDVDILANFQGRVNPEGYPTLAWFEYGPDTAYGQSSPTIEVGGGTVPMATAYAPKLLLPGSTWHVRLVASNVAGVAVGADVSLAFPSLPPGGAAPVFDGSDNGIRVVLPARLTNNYSISMWAFLGEALRLQDNPLCALVSSHECGSTAELNVGSIGNPSSTHQLMGFGRCNAYWPTYASTGVVPIQQWVHIAATVDGAGQIAYYIDGKPAGTANPGKANLVLGTNLVFGMSNHLDRRFKGAIDEISIWNVALSETTVRRIGTFGASAGEPGLVGYWRFDKLEGSKVTDSSGHGLDGILEDELPWIHGPLLGTLPLVTPAIVDGRLAVSFPTLAGHLYHLESKANLADTDWSEAISTTGDGSPITLVQLVSPNLSRFYRLRVE